LVQLNSLNLNAYRNIRSEARQLMENRILGLKRFEIGQARIVQVLDIFYYFSPLLFLISAHIQITVATLQQTAGITRRIITPSSTTFATLNIAFTSNNNKTTTNSFREI
jgi:hypothetical protein